MAIGSYRRCFLYFMRLHKVALISILFAAQCAGGSYKDKTLDVRDDFYNARFDNSAAKLRVFYQDAANKDKLLYLMEAGVVLHTKGDYETSLKVFKEASDIADSIETSVSGGVASFVLSDNESNFKGESYERVLIKLYLAMNSILLKDYESARKYFKKLNYDQKEIKMDEAAYKENNMARFLDAIISEQLKEYNDARVQYKNILQLSPNDEEMLINRYVLALKENDRGDQAKFGKVKNKLKGFNQKLDPVNYNTNMGELIIINQAGKAPTKESRGKIKQSPEFQVALQSAIEVAARTGGGNISANLSGVLLTLGESENPIPIYKDSNNIDKQPQEIYVNDKLIGNTQTLNDYAKITTTNFNDNYSKMVNKNVASIATKIVVATAAANVAANNPAANAAKNKVKEQCGAAGPLGFLCEMAVDKFADAAAGAATGALAGATISSDLRCWSLLPSNFQIKRLFFEPGEYTIKFKVFGKENEFTQPMRVKIEKGQPFVMNLRTVYNEPF